MARIQYATKEEARSFTAVSISSSRGQLCPYLQRLGLDITCAWLPQVPRRYPTFMRSRLWAWLTLGRAVAKANLGPFAE
jgi:hypothetical protein